MTVETRRSVDQLSWQGLKDAWYLPETAKPYRVLTCVSKSVETALVLGGLVGMVITKNPENFRMGLLSATGAATGSLNVAFDVLTILNNRERNAKQE